ncbi:M20/M25/M40 family metallo-hydrolase [Hymenobacter weizhouensis]|uniref:M20/M25/M40 family metallo-hydrolase n=1 Tax=Hymenobacter sp. YIM 151500-1 TaxID=2987689 RepID=UPI002226771E|nr:M20/M25/M40 family metallo-hydrolase [Hymenobacter sp. YIM 151500-1]UYZ64590.1 M20/M25/M40 family metallo-hydrolase [Hymenobacter sp. YIM 151500-1]
MKKIIFIFLLAYSAYSAAGQSKHLRVPDAGVSGATVERVVRALASDKLQGRASGTPGGQKAADILVSEFERIGLQPLPGLKGFAQTFPAYESRTVALFMSLNNVPVPKEKLVLISHAAHLNWSEEDEGAPRVLVIGPQDKPQQHLRDILLPRENLVVLLDPAHQADFRRLVVRVRRGSLRYDKEGNPYSTVVALSKVPETTTASGKIKFQVAANTAPRTVELRNVVGVLPGRNPARAAEQVIFSAHYDHIGVLPPVQGDSIANGADDDASGTTGVVALAEYFKKRNNNARTLVFVAFVAEEIGGFGSRYFAQHLDPKQVVAMFNIEMIGKQAKFGPNTAFITGFDKSNFGPLLQATLKGTLFSFEPDPYPEQNLFYRSDNATLARLGVPAHTISTDQIPTDKLYHSVDDEVDSLDLPNMTAVITAIGRSAAGIISGQQTPTRIAPDQVQP